MRYTEPLLLANFDKDSTKFGLQSLRVILINRCNFEQPPSFQYIFKNYS